MKKPFENTEHIKFGYIGWASAVLLEGLLAEASTALLRSDHPDSVKLRKRIWGARRMINDQIPMGMPEGEKEGLRYEEV